MDNGNLIFPPFQASDYKQDVHAQTYRCIAENELGRIQSRDVHVRAGRDNFPSLLFLTDCPIIKLKNLNYLPKLNLFII